MLLAWFALASEPALAAADEDMPYMRDGVPQPLPPEDLVTYYRSSLFRGEHVLLDKALFEGDCEPLLQALERGDFYSPVLVDIWSELPDRGLCMPFDPEEAARRLERALTPEDAPSEQAILAWKYHYGHGVARDPARARDLFIGWVMDLWPWMKLSGHSVDEPETVAEVTIRNMAGRPVPQEFLDVLAWTEQQISTDEGAIALGKALIWGGDLAYADGAPLPRRPNAGVHILRRVNDIDARYHVGLAEMDGHYRSRNFFPLEDLRAVAQCGHTRAATILARLYHSGEHPLVPLDPDEAEMWRLVALSLGVAKADLFDPSPHHLQSYLPIDLEVRLRRILEGRACYLR